MPERIPQSTAIRVPLLAYLTGTTTPATGQTIAITISKNGGAFANPSGGATNATEIANGAYYVDLTTPDTGTLGPLIILGTASGVDNVFAIYDITLATNGGWTGVPNIAAGAVGGLPLSFDSAGGVNVAQWLGHAVTVDANNAPNVSAKYWAGAAITATSIPVAVAAGANGGLLKAGSNAATTFATLTITGVFSINGVSDVAQTGDSFAVVDSGTFGNSALHTQIGTPFQSGSYTAPDNTGIAAIQAQTDKMGFTGTGPWTINANATISGDVTVGGYASGQDPATLVLDASASAHDTAGTIGAQINAAATAGDPWAVDLPGPYVSPQAGAILPALVRTVVTYTGPINPTTGDVTLICGDDYYSADGRALTFGVPTGGGNPDLTGATVTANWYLAAQTNPVASVNGTVSSPGTINQAVTYQVPSDTTDLLIASRYILVLQAVLSDASIVTFARLNCTVISPPNGTIPT